MFINFFFHFSNSSQVANNMGITMNDSNLLQQENAHPLSAFSFSFTSQQRLSPKQFETPTRNTIVETNIKGTLIDNIDNTKVAPSPLHGYGLFATAGLEAGTLLCNLDGQLVSWRFHQRNPISQEWNAVIQEYLLVRTFKTKYFAINHSREPNVVLTPDHPVSTLRSKRDIQAGEEILLDYRDQPLPEDYLNGHGKTYL